MDVFWLLAVGVLFGLTAGLAVGCGRLPGGGAMSLIYLIGGTVAVALLGYLVYALIRAEEF